MTIVSFDGLTPRIHPSAWVHPSVEILGDVTLGEDASVWPGCVLRGDSGAIVVEGRANIQDATVLHATTGLSQTTVGAGTTVGHRAILHGCRVGADCLVGMGSILLDGVTLGAHCFVAAGSLLPPGAHFAPGSFVLGSPARRLREVSAREIEIILESAKRYVALARKHRSDAPHGV